jgi:hypothetical protein
MNPGEEQVVFYMEIGLALTQWAHVENAIRHLTTAPFKEELDRNAVSVGFFSIDAFRSKLGFSKALIARILAGTPHGAEWVKLIDRAQSASQERNKLAH